MKINAANTYPEPAKTKPIMFTSGRRCTRQSIISSKVNFKCNLIRVRFIRIRINARVVCRKKKMKILNKRVHIMSKYSFPRIFYKRFLRFQSCSLIPGKTSSNIY